MQSIFDAITQWIKDLLIGSIESSLSSMFGDVNEKVGTIAAQVGTPPQGGTYNVKGSNDTTLKNIGKSAICGTNDRHRNVPKTKNTKGAFYAKRNHLHENR